MTNPLTDVPTPHLSIRDLAMRALFGAASMAGPSVHATICSAYFGFKYRVSDPWDYDTNEYERRKYARTLEVIGQHECGRVLEVGCAEGAFTRALAEGGHGREILAIDISGKAISRARERCRAFPHVRFEQGDAFGSRQPGRFDLIVCAEILYYAGRRGHALARSLAGALNPGGRIVLVHPWPESEVLHAPFRTVSSLVAGPDRIEHDVARPYALAVFGLA